MMCAVSNHELGQDGLVEPCALPFFLCPVTAEFRVISRWDSSLSLSRLDSSFHPPDAHFCCIPFTLPQARPCFVMIFLHPNTTSMYVETTKLLWYLPCICHSLRPAPQSLRIMPQDQLIEQ
jgi:hypothetical protein